MTRETPTSTTFEAEQRLPDVASIHHRHQEIREAMQQIQGVAERILNQVVPRYDPRPLLALLRSFQMQIREHFALEERGLLRSYPEREPKLRALAEELQGQHAGLLEDLDRIIAELDERGGLRREGLARIAAETADLFARMQAHDIRESELLDRAASK